MKFNGKLAFLPLCTLAAASVTFVGCFQQKIPVDGQDGINGKDGQDGNNGKDGVLGSPPTFRRISASNLNNTDTADQTQTIKDAAKVCTDRRCQVVHQRWIRSHSSSSCFGGTMDLCTSSKEVPVA